MEQRKACQRCRRLKQACNDQDGVSCVKCYKAGEDCSLSITTTLLTNGKRKSEDIGDKPERVVREKRAILSAPVSHTKLDALNASCKTNRPKPLQQLQNKQKRKANLNTGSWKCGICEKNDRKAMIQCKNKACNSWCHNDCIRSCQNPRHRLFAPALNFRDWRFICPKCVDQPDGHFSQEIADYSMVMERISRLIDSQTNSSHRTEEFQHRFNEYTDPGPTGELIPGFEPSKEERFQGFVEAEVNSLVSSIDQSIYDYNREILDTIERFSDRNHGYVTKPLTDWKLVDTNDDAVAGRSWYNIPWEEIEGRTRSKIRSHHPITAALRSMLGIIDGEPLEIDRDLFYLTFSQVHTGFVGWFVIDVLANSLDIDELPNMLPMRAMMAAVKEFANSRWPGMGQHSLREVQLRTWYKGLFQRSILQDDGHLMRRMETFLDPLTDRFENIGRWSLHRADIIEHTIRLWTYLQSVRGKFSPIHPEVGSLFKPREHEAYDQNGTLIEADADMRIAWIMRRGFEITEDGVDGSRSMIVKARVHVE